MVVVDGVVKSLLLRFLLDGGTQVFIMVVHLANAIVFGVDINIWLNNNVSLVLVTLNIDCSALLLYI
jgi:hypothetical protein